MSHFIMGIVVPKDTKNVSEYVERKMAYYYEWLEMPETLVKCYSCKGRKKVKGVDKRTPLACSECKGTGKVSTNYNPNAKWDWYVIGGRWDGHLTHKEPDVKDGDNFPYDEKYKNIGNNITTVNQHLLEVKKDFEKNRCFGLIDSKGHWFEKGKMGWWAIVSNEKKTGTWKKEYIDVLKHENKDNLIVALDCHI